MQALSQSAFLQALGYAIANSLWQCALLWLVVFAVNSFIKFSSRTKYTIALIAQCTGFVWFIFTFNFYFTRCSEIIANIGTSVYSNGMPVVIEPQMNSFSSGLLYFIAKTEQFLPWLSIAYLILLVFLSVRWIRCYRFTQQIKHTQLHKAGVEWKLFVKRIAAELNIKPEVKIYLSELVKGPVTIGFLKPAILIPLASINHLSVEQMEAVILHELAHIKRADYLINILQSIIEITLFFNPFTQLLSRMIKQERENSCDDWVLQYKYNASMYAEALLRIAVLQSPSKFAMQASGTKGDLLSRVKRMLNQKEKTFNYRNHLLALVLMTGILSSVAWFHPSPAIANPANAYGYSNTQHVVVEPLTAKVDNPFFNPVFFLSKPLSDEINNTIENEQLNIDKATSIAEKAKDIVVENITPVALEKLRNLSSGLEDQIKSAYALANKSYEDLNLQNINAHVASLMDSAALVSALTNTLENNFPKIDFQKMNEDLAKAKLDIANMSKDKTLFSIGAEKWKDVLSKSLQQVQNFAKDIQQKDPGSTAEQRAISNKKLQEAQENLKQNTESMQRLIEIKKIVMDSLQHLFSSKKDDVDEAEEDDAQTQVAPVSANATGYDNSYSYNYSVGDATSYAPVNFTTTVSPVIDSEYLKKPILVLLKGDLKNPVSCKKNISIETYNSKGEKHVYSITIETYQ